VQPREGLRLLGPPARPLAHALVRGAHPAELLRERRLAQQQQLQQLQRERRRAVDGGRVLGRRAQLRGRPG